MRTVIVTDPPRADAAPAVTVTVAPAGTACARYRRNDLPSSATGATAASPAPSAAAPGSSSSTSSTPAAPRTGTRSGSAPAGSW